VIDYAFTPANVNTGAMGCGAYFCPPTHVALEMKAILLDPEFKGWFKEVVFAVYSTPANGEHNFKAFQQVFDGVTINGEVCGV
jgi:uncharacterized protein (TIGR02452 family)